MIAKTLLLYAAVKSFTIMKGGWREADYRDVVARNSVR